MSKTPLVVLSAKVDPEVKAMFDRAFDETEATTKNQFYEILLESFLNPKVKPVDNPDHVKLIQEQETKIKQLTSEIEAFQGAKNESDKLIAETQHQNSILENQLKELENRPPEGLKLEPNQGLITYPQIIGLVLDKEAEKAARIAKKPFNRADILLNCFWETIKDGSYTPYRLWSNAELKRAVKSLTEQKPKEETPNE